MANRLVNGTADCLQPYSSADGATAEDHKRALEAYMAAQGRDALCAVGLSAAEQAWPELASFVSAFTVAEDDDTGEVSSQ